MSIAEVRQHDNGFYYVHWSEGRRSKRESLGVKEEAEAQKRYAQWLLLGGQSPAHEASYAVAELWPIYAEKHEVASVATRDFIWKNSSAHFGPIEVAAITQDSVDDYQAKRAVGRIGRPAGASTVRRELAALRACLNWCAAPKRKIITTLPVFDLPPEGEARDRWLRTEEIQRLLTAAGELRGERNGKDLLAHRDNLRDERVHRGVGDEVQHEQADGRTRLSRGERFLWLALETAARKSAILELTWDRVDFETNVIHLNVPGRAVTKKRRADVPISKALRPVLLRAYEERIGELVMDNRADVWTVVQLIAERAGFAEPFPRRNGAKPRATGISPHVLRHTAATHMARNGVSLYAIGKILGNSHNMVEKVYAKWCPDDPTRTVDLISNGKLEAAE